MINWCVFLFYKMPERLEFCDGSRWDSLNDDDVVCNKATLTESYYYNQITSRAGSSPRQAAGPQSPTSV
jgi:hypothetical protein